MSFAERCRREVEELHAFFMEWFGGRLPDTPEAFARFERALADAFELVSPGGATLTRAEILTLVREAHRRHAPPAPPLRIWIEACRVRAIASDLAIAHYEEWQEKEGTRRGRQSSALLRRRPEAPGGVEWLLLCEVWLPAGRAPRRPPGARTAAEERT